MPDGGNAGLAPLDTEITLDQLDRDPYPIYRGCAARRLSCA
jgi:hypothetical protein